MQRPELLGLLHVILQHDLVTAKVRTPAALDAVVRDHVELGHETAIIATPKCHHAWRQMAIGFVVSLVTSFALTSCVSALASVVRE